MSTAGCQSAKVSTPLTASLAGNDADSQLNFWHTLADSKLTSNDDAFHGLLLYLDEHDDSADYAARVMALKQRSLIPSGFNESANDAVRRGTIAVAFVKILAIKGGWAMHVFGPTPRYAVRELQYLAIFPYSSPQQTFSGAEYVGVIGSLEDYQSATPQMKTQPAAPGPTSAPMIPQAAIADFSRSG